MAVLVVMLVILVPWIGALAVWLVGEQRELWQHRLAVAFALVAAGLSLILVPSATSAVSVRLPLGGQFGDLTLIPDGLGVLLAAIASVVGSLAVIFSTEYMRGESQLGRYYALVLLFIGSMSGLVLTGSLLLMFVFWEMTALCSYALISFHNDDPRAVAGGLKALIITQLGGLGLLAGVLVAYAGTGSYDVQAFLAGAATLPAGSLAVIAFGFLIAAAAKSAQFPFHSWLPGAMEAPSPISALIHAATMVNAGVYLLARFYPAFAQVPGWSDWVMAVGLISALLGAFMALVAGDLKRVLAYSTISQLGYMVFAVGTGAIFAAQFHLLSHALFKALLFLGAGAVIHAVGTREISQMGGLGSRMPFIRNTFLIGALALVGLPIANGFWSKELILEAAQEHTTGLTVFLLITGVLLTALYTVRVMWLVFFGRPRTSLHAHDATPAMRLVLAVLALGVLTSWLLAGPVGAMLHETLPYHEVHAQGTNEVIGAVLSAPVTWLALLVVGLGCGLWFWRSRLVGLVSALRPIARAASVDFGFEWLNHSVLVMTQRSAIFLRQSQTGQLNWNLVGIVLGLVMVLVVLMWGR